MPVVRILANGLTIAGLSMMAAIACGAEPQLVVDVASGRQFRGSLDAASSGEQLVIRSEQAGVTLRRSIRWERVVRAMEDGVAVDVDRLRARAQERSSWFKVQSSKPDRSQKTLLKQIEMRGEPVASAEPAVEELPAPRVTMVAFDASIANWDADVETDGVLINVAPLDSNGYLVPVSGTLEVELFAPQRRTLDLAPQSGGDTLEVVERWTRAITPADFGPSGARLRLPFGAITPELQPNWTAWHYGLVHVRLSIPGQGVFEDSRDGVRIKPFAPNRDRLEMKTGQRFLSSENLGRRE